MPTIETTEDADGARLRVTEGVRGAIVTVLSRTRRAPHTAEQVAALVHGTDRRRAAEAVLGEPVLTRTELVRLLDLNPDDEAVRTADAEELAAAITRLTQDVDRSAQALADLTEASRVLEADVVVRRSDLPAVEDGTGDYEDSRVVTCAEVGYGTPGQRHPVFAAHQLSRPVADARRGALVEVALWVDARDRAEAEVAAEAERLTSLAEPLRPFRQQVGGQVLEVNEVEVVSALLRAGWTPPAPVDVPF